MRAPIVLVYGAATEVGDLVASLLEPYRIEVVRSADADEALLLVRQQERLDLAILLPDTAANLDEFTTALKDVAPSTRVMRLERYVARSPGLEESVETGSLSLDGSELLELIEAAVRSSGSAPRSVVAADDKRDLAVRIILGLTSVIESMTYVSGGNARAIMEDAVRIGQELGLSQHMLDEIAVAALLQDVGMARLQRDSSGAYLEVETHCAQSAEVAQSMRLPWRVRPVIMAHHEHYDGLGYPAGLAGRQIPVGARILSVVTSFYAMIAGTGGPGSRRLTKVDAVEQLSSLAGRQFDPEVVEIFIGLIHDRSYPDTMERRIAVVAVDDMTRGTLSLRFVRSGYEVWFLTADAESVKAMSEHPPSGVVVGVSSNDPSGMEFLHWLRAEGRLRELPAIALVDRDDGLMGAQAALDLGADDALVKPFKPRDLVMRVGGLIRRRRRHQESDTISIHSGEALRSRLDQWPLPQLCQMLRDGRKTARVSVRAAGREGAFGFDRGHLVDATMAGLKGDEAFLEMLKLRSGYVSVAHGVGPPRRTITRSLDALLMESLAHTIDETGKGLEELNI